MARTLAATPANMEKLRAKSGDPIAAPGVFAWSPATDERYSASPGDYFMAAPDHVLRDTEGEPMILVRERTRIVSAT